MPNKFTKGILERQEREYKQQRTNPPEREETPLFVEPSPPAQKPQPVQPREPEAPFPNDLEAYIIRDNGRKAKNKTFYLDGAVIQAIKRAAATQRVTESKLVNDILKKILIP